MLLRLGRDAVDGLAARLPAPARAALVRARSGCRSTQPPAFFWWWFSYDAYAPQIFVEGAYIAASGGFISVAVRHRHVGLARAGGKERRDLRLGALGRTA